MANMNSRIKLSDYCLIKGRFHRSVNIEKDYKTGREGYILTTTAQELATRILGDLTIQGAPRTWTITGPYGSGKSSFLLFLSELLSGDNESVKLENLFQDDSIFAICPFANVLIVGRRSSLKTELLQALLATVSGWSNRKPARFIKSLLKTSCINDADCIRAFEIVLNVASIEGYTGLSLMIDEFGKLLEFAGLHPENDELYLMQELAELASRSSVTFLIITVLHSAITSYLPHADRTREREWAKIQGRYHDVTFLEPPEQMLSLVSDSISFVPPSDIALKYAKQNQQTLDSPVLNSSLEKLPVRNTLENTVPLHPVTSLLLWPLFRSELAQNERSLFSFLTSSEPYGFQEFLKEPIDNGIHPYYSVSNLFDYVSNVLGLALFRGLAAQKWTEISSALDRISPDAPELSEDIVKIIGLLNLYGEQIGLKADLETISLITGNRKQTKDSIEYLGKESIAIFRKHLRSYAIWQGSDFDIDKLYATGKSKIEALSLEYLLNDIVDISPSVVRSHYFRTGTMRTFEYVVTVASIANIDRFISYNTSNDGLIVYAIGATKVNRSAVINHAVNLSSRLDNPTDKPIIFVFPEEFAGLENALVEVDIWKWILGNTPTLSSDKTARQEVVSRMEYAETFLGELIGQIFGLPGYKFLPEKSTWIYQGDVITLCNSNEFHGWLSGICDKVYCSSPIFKNEMLNRNYFSSAGSAARNALHRALLSYSQLPELGLEGTPPEKAIYETMIKTGNFHKLRKGKFILDKPTGSWEPAWQAIESFLWSTSHQRRSLVELYEILENPPYGMKQGPIPTLVLLALLYHQNNIAIYESSGLFIPAITDELVELLSRVPEEFEIQYFTYGTEEKTYLRELREVLSLDEAIDSAQDDLIPIVRKIILVAAKLPHYSRYTDCLNPETLKLRTLLLSAKDPNELLFVDIPKIYSNSSGRCSGTTGQLLESLIEMRNAYPKLLNNIEAEIKSVFNLTGNDQDVRATLTSRAEQIMPYATEPVLALFAKESARMGDRDWREILARVIQNGTPPDRWSDHDNIEFQVKLKLLRNHFVRLEELVAEQRGHSSEKIIRISILGEAYNENRFVVPINTSSKITKNNIVLKKKINDLLDFETHEASERSLSVLSELIIDNLNDPNETTNHD